MKRWFKFAASLLALAGVATLFSGCPQKNTEVPPTPPKKKPVISQPVALSPEAMKAAPQVAVSLTETAIKVTPNTVPSGPLVLNVTNNCKVDKAFVFTGAGNKPESQNLKPGSKGTVTLYSAKPGNYSIIVPAAKKTDKSITATLTVGGPAPTTGKPQMPNGTMKQGAPMPMHMPGKPGGPPTGAAPPPPAPK